MDIATLDLFCGAGGSSAGAAAAGARIVCGVDAWEIATLTYGDNFPGALAVNRELKPSSGRTEWKGIGKIDLLLASPECTNHTCAKGGRPRDEGSRLTARYVLNFARTLRPRWVVVENVVQMRRWSGYKQLLEELSRCYYVTTQVLDAADFGVPQTRRRLFLLCDRECKPSQVVPGPRIRKRNVAGILDRRGTWESRLLFNGTRAAPTLERARRAIRSLGEGVPFLLVYYGSDGAGGWQTLDRPLRTLTTIDRFGLVEWDGRDPVMRMLQVPELRRAMGFPATYRFERGTRRDRIRLLGNGVCPPVMKATVSTLADNQ